MEAHEKANTMSAQLDGALRDNDRLQRINQESAERFQAKVALLQYQVHTQREHVKHVDQLLRQHAASERSVWETTVPAMFRLPCLPCLGPVCSHVLLFWPQTCTGYHSVAGGAECRAHLLAHRTRGTRSGVFGVALQSEGAGGRGRRAATLREDAEEAWKQSIKQQAERANAHDQALVQECSAWLKAEQQVEELRQQLDDEQRKCQPAHEAINKCAKT